MRGAEPPSFSSHSHPLRGRQTSVTVWACPIPAPSRDAAPAATRAPLGAISGPIPEIANPTGVDTEVVSDTRHQAGPVLATKSGKARDSFLTVHPARSWLTLIEPDEPSKSCP